MSKEKKCQEKNSLKAEERILKAATDVFAEKGYDAAGVDEIAKRADVTKPLIYYYFKGKKTILEKIIKRYIDMAVEEEEQYEKSMVLLDKEMQYKRLSERMKMFSQNKKILKIISMEMLKDKWIDKLSDFYQLYNLALPRIEKMEIDKEEQMDTIFMSFFFGTIPAVIFTLFGENFCEFYDLDRQEAEIKFIKAMKSMYVDYFFDYFQENQK